MQVTERLDAAFAETMDAFQPFEKNPVFATALSGGADSTALCRMAEKYAARVNGTVLALIVNHNLRPESKTEAEAVARQCAERHVPFEILTVDTPPVARLEETARKMRYRLLFDACKKRDCFYLLTGHHAKDVSETVAMRRSHRSGVAGLAGINACQSADFGFLIRPLLRFSPDDLRTYNRENNLSWVEDSTNSSDVFERNRIRKTLSAVSCDNELKIAENASESRRKTESETDAFLARFARFDASGTVFFTRAAVHAASDAHWLGDVLRFVGQKPYAPNADSLQTALLRLKSPDFKGLSLGGCFIASLSKEGIYICRESNNMPAAKNVVNAATVSWGIFHFRISEPFTGTVRALGNEKIPEKIKTALPKRCFKTLPAFFDKQGLFLVPHLGYKRKSIACETTFAPKYRAGRDIGWIFNKAVK